MTKPQAIWALICDLRRGGKLTKASYAKVNRACKVLGMTEEEQNELEFYLEYRASVNAEVKVSE